VDDELKKIRNPKLMTVRQRALLERKGELQNEEIIKEELVALPTGTKFPTKILF
jgi:INO80 complex subunit B